ncbi:hypothetical protein D6C76_01240 [Aureobasidium pullulans]|nr:hypothetical protein D6C76_01240 [Aureobasidium pullulans]
MSFSPIACESCRSKKRKVGDDSFIRHVRNARTQVSRVHILEQARGYIAKIEERLAHTEAALLQALSTIHASEARAVDNVLPAGPTSETVERQQLEFNEIRIAKVEEWQRYPLDSEQQQREWMRHRLSTGDLQAEAPATAHQADEPEPLHHHSNQQIVSTRKRQRTNISDQQQPDTAASPEASERTRGPESLSAWTANTFVQDSYNNQPKTQSPAPVLPPTSNPSTSDPTSIQDPQPPSKAKRLSTLHSRKYF